MSFNFFNKIPLRNKLIICTVASVFVAMILVGMYFYFSISSVLTNNAYENLLRTIEQTGQSLDNAYITIHSTSLNVLTTPTIRQMLTEGHALSYNNIYPAQYKAEIESEMQYNLWFSNAYDSKMITTMYLFMDEENSFAFSRSAGNAEQIKNRNLEIYRKMLAESDLGINGFPPSQSDPTIYFARQVFDLRDPNQFSVLVLGTSESRYRAKYENILTTEGAIAFIMDDAGILYSHPDQTKLGTRAEESFLNSVNVGSVNEITLEGQKYLSSSKAIAGSGLTFIAAIPKSQVLAVFSGSMKQYFAITFIIVIFSLMVSLLLSLRFTRFLDDLLFNLNKVKQGNYSFKMPIYSDHDLAAISSTFNNMTEKVNYLINEVYENQLRLKESELKFLQSQMNPHFLLNVLTTIDWKARLVGDDTIHQMVVSLSELMQAGLHGGTTHITIRQEMEYVQYYLYLQKIRFEDKLRYEICIEDPEVLDCYIPRLCIEPLVENAIVHGLETKRGKGQVVVTVKISGGVVVVDIVDDGVGFQTDSEIFLRDADEMQQDGQRHHIGLVNTHRRLRLLYGETFGLKIFSRLGVGSRVTLRIPLCEKEEQSCIPC